MRRVIQTLLAVAFAAVGCSGGGSDGPVSPGTDLPRSDNPTVRDVAEETGGGCGTECGTMVTVPAGSFMMGCNEAMDTQCFADEYPYHDVTLPEYRIGKYEVTVGEYQKCVAAGPCIHGVDDNLYYTSTNSGSCNFGAAGKGEYPMNCVTWAGAHAYCEWAGQRLPTEAEWEKAARGTDGRKYPWGNEGVSCNFAVMHEDDDVDDPFYMYADDDSAWWGCDTRGTWLVGSKGAGESFYGALDMIGNVAEWVSDYYDGAYYKTSPASDPTGPDSVGNRVIRGGSYIDANVLPHEIQMSEFHYYLRASSRRDRNPTSYYSGLGFRCAK